MDEKLSLFRIRMLDVFSNGRLLYYVMPSETASRKRWTEEYANSTWRLDSITQIDQIDGYQISFLEKTLDASKSE